MKKLCCRRLLPLLCLLMLMTAMLGMAPAGPACVREQAAAASPFDPYTPAEVPAGPYQPVLDAAELEGTWHHYLDPATTLLPSATYQCRFEDGRLTLGLGTWQTDSGVGYTGQIDAFYGGGVTGRVRQVQMEPEAPLIGPEVAVTVATWQPPDDPDTLLITLLYDGPVPDSFTWAFGAICGYCLVFTRYSG